MIIDKETYKELKNDTFVFFNTVSTLATFEFGYKGYKHGESFNLTLIKSGILCNFAFKSKIYIKYDDIKDVSINGEKLILNIFEEDDFKDVVFKIENTDTLEKVYLTLREHCNLGYKEYSIEAKANEEVKVSKRKEEKERIKKLKKEKIPYCPKCKSTNISTTKGKVGIGKAVVGIMTIGMVRNNKVDNICMNCGKRWRP